MTPDDRIVQIFGWRERDSGVRTPNIADSSSQPSLVIAGHIFEELQVSRTSREAAQTLGKMLESAVGGVIADGLLALAPNQPWVFGSEKITVFEQYSHLQRLENAMAVADPDGTIRAELGSDYIIRPDVTVGLHLEAAPEPFLHAAISCKWTIRSDRVQNIRHEGVVLTRHRRGRQPHIVTVTAEPLPSRLASIAQGTGEVDCVYHVAMDQLERAVSAVGSPSDVDLIEELITQQRLRPLDTLPEILSTY